MASNASGALGTLMLSDAAAGPRSWEQASGENPAYDPHGDEDGYIVAGTQGSLAVPTLRLREYEGEASWMLPLQCRSIGVRHADPLQRQLAHFCAMIRGEAAPVVSVFDALRTLEVTLAVAEAARSGRRLTCFPE